VQFTVSWSSSLLIGPPRTTASSLHLVTADTSLLAFLRPQKTSQSGWQPKRRGSAMNSRLPVCPGVSKPFGGGDNSVSLRCCVECMHVALARTHSGTLATVASQRTNERTNVANTASQSTNERTNERMLNAHCSSE